MNNSQLARELMTAVLPLALIISLTGAAAAWWTHGFIPGSRQLFPLAHVAASHLHLVLLGLVSGFLLGLVGQAAGAIALPYSVGMLGFQNLHVTPTLQLVTLLNPLAAVFILGRARAAGAAVIWTCAGGVVGGFCGPMLRVTVMQGQLAFSVLVAALVGVSGVYLSWRALKAEPHTPPIECSPQENPESGGPVGARRGLALMAIGLGVGTVSATAGLAGGAILVPLLLLVGRWSLEAIAAVSLPYTVVLSASALVTFNLLFPMIGLPAVAPEWLWGCLVGAGGVVGAWLAVRTAHRMPLRRRELLLGALNIAVAVYFLSRQL